MKISDRIIRRMRALHGAFENLITAYERDLSKSLNRKEFMGSYEELYRTKADDR
jgi:hypothetical protein